MFSYPRVRSLRRLERRLYKQTGQHYTNAQMEGLKKAISILILLYHFWLVYHLRFRLSAVTIKVKKKIKYQLNKMEVYFSHT